jgi:hypothetical protein
VQPTCRRSRRSTNGSTPTTATAASSPVAAPRTRSSIVGSRDRTTGADVVVAETEEALLDAVRRAHPGAPICLLESGANAAEIVAAADGARAAEADEAGVLAR